MKWIEAKIEVDREKADIVAANLLDFDIEGVEIIDAHENRRFIEEDASNWDYVDDNLVNVEEDSCLIKFYVSEDAGGILPAVRDALSYFGIVKTATVEDSWSEAWKQHYKPFKIGDKIVIVPVWEEYKAKDSEIVFKIEPGHVFGTGQHQSTALCIALLEKYVAAGDSVLDIGCGSGILGLIAILLGASSACAIDIDPSAAKVSLENARLNNIGNDRYTASTRNILNEAIPKNAEQFNIITANIVADIIIPMMPYVKAYLRTGGVFVTGGIIKDRQGDVAAALVKNGFKIAETKAQDEWVAIAAITH